MPDKIEAKGACMCGAVSYRASAADAGVGTCHCKMCRRWCGGPMFASECGMDVVFEGEENIGVYSSSEWAERGFCKTCGSNLFYRLQETKHYFMAVGTFDAEVQLKLDHQVFIDEKPDYYAFKGHENLKNLTGAELFAMFSGEDEG